MINPITELLTIEQKAIEGKEIQTVNARNLHQALGVGKMFQHWIKDRIKRAGFIEGQDFIWG
ncbi:hypothetical protein A4G19_02175 [Pasteurellaceae bacterium Macca]|nr:hypothetical protein [Pasteurellaceae bacterium Macca]